MKKLLLYFEANKFSPKYFNTYKIGEAKEYAEKNGLREMDVSMVLGRDKLIRSVKVSDMEYPKLEEIFNEYLKTR